MTILCIETSTSVCSAAILRDGVPIKQMINKEGSNHARLLPLFIEQLLQLAQEEGLRIDAVALSEGPGSYTGLRIGTSMAKGLCYGLNVPLIPIPTLKVLCEAAKQSTEYRVQSTEYRVQSTDILCPMIDARRMEVYAAIYDSRQLKVESLKLKENSARAVVVENEDSLMNEGVNELMNEGVNVYYFGDGAEKCSRVFTKENWHYLPDIVPEAQYVGRLAVTADRLQVSGERIAYYEPFYLKEFVAAQSHVKGLKS